MSMRSIIAMALGAGAAIFSFVAAVGVTGSAWVGALCAAAVGAGVAVRLRRASGFALDESAVPRFWKVVAGVAAVVALALITRLALFMVDPGRVGASTIPASRWETEHSCLTAYFVAAEAVSAGATGGDVYDEALYSLPDDGSGPRKPRMLGPFRIDVYEYPPPFLLLPRLLRLAAPDFTRFRMLWFGLTGGFVLAAVVAVARSMGPQAGTRALLLAPLLFMALTTMSTLQKGNLQPLVIGAAMLAMLLFERRRWAAGGMLLAFATASKLYPGLLLVYLAAGRRWRAVAWTAVSAAALGVASLLDVGWAPYRAFLDHLPGLLGGEAFPAFRNPAAIAANYSIPGLVFKARLFGVPGMSFAAAKIVGWAYTLVAIAATVYAARLAPGNDRKPLVWMAILIVATLRSPFLPQAYAPFPALWLLTLLGALAIPPDRRRLGLVLAGWAALNLYWPVDWPLDPRWLALGILLPQGLTIALVIVALRIAGRPEASGSPPSRAETPSGAAATLPIAR